MKTLKSRITTLGVLGLLMLISATAKAQTYEIGVYISGYAGEAWNGGNLWETRGVPDNWDSMFDYSINLDQEVVNLLSKAKTSHNKLAQIHNKANVQATVTPQLVSAVQQLPINGSSVEVQFVLIGHGALGGLLARYIAGGAAELGLDTIRNPLNGEILAEASFAVVTVGTPNQGLPLVEAVNKDINGFRNVEPTLMEFENKVHDALKTKLSNVVAMAGMVLAIAMAVSSALSGNLLIAYAISSLFALGGFVGNTYLNQTIEI